MGILPVQVSPEFLTQIFSAIELDPHTKIEVSLPNQTITIQATGAIESFEMNGYKKNNLINGFDDIDYLQAMKSEISAFAAARAV
jgi:3-isopropylmalate/(R)-2-methylmalate dehydratase small subunit